MATKPISKTNGVSTTAKKPITLVDLANDRVRVLEGDNLRLRKRVSELEARICVGGDVGSLVHKAITESAKQLPVDQRVQSLVDRIGSLEAELASRSGLNEEERSTNTETQRVQLEQNILLAKQVEEYQKKEEEYKQCRRELVELKEKLQSLQQQERHSREDATREAQSCTKLQQEILTTRSEHVDKLQALHKKYREELSIKDSQIEKLKGVLDQQERLIQELNSTVTHAETLSRQSNASDAVTTALSVLNTTLATVADGLERTLGTTQAISSNTQSISDGIQNIATKTDMHQLGQAIATTQEEKTDAAGTDERLSGVMIAVTRLAEEYGASNVDSIDPIGILSTTIRNTLRQRDDLLQQEIRRAEEQRNKHEQDKRDQQRTQDKMLHTIEQLLEQITELGQSKGLTPEQAQSILDKYHSG